MKKIIVLIFCVVMLHACKEDEIQKGNAIQSDIELGDTTKSNDIPTPEIPLISLSTSAFHSVIGWISNDEIAMILMDKGEWTVQIYTVSNSSWNTIYTSSVPIIQGSIHPNKELILLHTSNNSSMAEVQILDIKGQLVKNLSFESDELYMDWHPTNPDLIVFTAFYEDWTYNTFIYDGSTQGLETIDVENPFVKWYDEEHLMVFRWAESSLDGSELMLYSIKEEKLEYTGVKNVLNIQMFGENVLYTQVNEVDNQYEFRLLNKATSKSFEWDSPAISNYSEWVVPIVNMIQTDHVIMMKSMKPGNVDEFSGQSIISSVTLDGQEDLGKIAAQPIQCAPNGQVCLGGYELENWIQLNPFKEKSWIHFEE